MNFGNLKYYSRYNVPEGFRDMLMDLVKEILRDQPADVVEYCAEYFRAKEEGREMDYKDIGARPIPPNRITRAELEQIRGYEEGDAERVYSDEEYQQEGEYPEGEGGYMNGEGEGFDGGYMGDEGNDGGYDGEDGEPVEGNEY